MASVIQNIASCPLSTSPTLGMSSDQRYVQRRQRRPDLAPDVPVVQQSGEAEREHIEQQAGDDLIGPAIDVEEGQDHPGTDPGEPAESQGQRDILGSDSDEGSGQRADQHGPFDAHVEHAAALRDGLAQRSQQNGHHQLQASGEERDDDGFGRHQSLTFWA